MSQWNFLFSSIIITFLYFNLNLFLTNSETIVKNLEYPCKPPYNSYPFCDTSLPITTRAQSIISHLTLPEKIQQLCNNASGIPRLGIPAYEWWSESLHGIATNGPGITFNGTIQAATSFPQVIVTASAFNRTLWYAIGAAIGVEARAMYNVGQAGLTFWAPNINIFRDPRWGRGQETPGEDPMVASAFAVDFVRGFQREKASGGGGNVKRVVRKRSLSDGDDDGNEGLMLSACCKHMIAYDLELWNNFARYNFNAVVTAQDMQDTYQPPFQSCIQQGKASCLMCSYNAVNGIPACADKELLQKARNDWGFEGYITSDCDAVATIFEYQNYTKSPEDAVAIALKSGTDINCGTYMLFNTKSAIEQGKVQEMDIDKALLNLFLVQLRLGLFNGDPTKGPYGKLGPKDVCSTEHKTLALEAARQGIVLLKNRNKFLPFNKDSISSIAVIGPLANNTSKMGGGYTGIPCSPKSIFEGLQAYVKNVNYAPGCLAVSCESTSGFEEAISIAKDADIVVIVAGLDLSQETEDHDRYSLLLPGFQSKLITTIAAISKKPLVLVITGGGPIDLSMANGDERIASILWIGYPGEAGGNALAEIIFGDYNPGGRLPLTWYPEAFTSVPMNDMNMRADPSRDYPGRTYRFYTGKVVYGFGYGLSFTNYTYKLLNAPKQLTLSGSISPESKRKIQLQIGEGYQLDYINLDEVESCNSLKFNVQVSVMNEGEMDGSHVIMLYSRVTNEHAGAPRKQLIGFDRVQTTSYRGTESSFLVDPCNHFSFANEHGKRILPLGDHALVLEDQEHIVSIQI
ncbi:probable beta-D-xylosidase 6 [Daucus carota subsp. sativus]|uniref:probable beta-D-xylosidase 6 n=1 Tax=Daucus carota subsp. sativus TaxID=79200 RepID=UPI0007EF9D77|nr:PREDICTED: probable beta-D-xylosidase 6 [Daucus carota subsp. sativus]